MVQFIGSARMMLKALGQRDCPLMPMAHSACFVFLNSMCLERSSVLHQAYHERSRKGLLPENKPWKGLLGASGRLSLADDTASLAAC